MPAPDQLLSYAYFPPISWFVLALKEGKILLDPWENYQKQSYRNRCRILGPNGPQDLSIPVKHGGNRRIRELEISYSENWQKEHWKSLESAYRRSPYFEFYEDSLKPLYEQRPGTLRDLDRISIEIALKFMKLDISIKETEAYFPSVGIALDLRDRIHPKKTSLIKTSSYLQVFSDRLDFHSDLSILDLIFNLGPESRSYLENCSMK